MMTNTSSSGEMVRWFGIESGMDANSTEIRSGDEIVVLPKVPVKNLQVVATISQIIFQMALTAATVFGL